MVNRCCRRYMEHWVKVKVMLQTAYCKLQRGNNNSCQREVTCSSTLVLASPALARFSTCSSIIQEWSLEQLVGIWLVMMVIECHTVQWRFSLLMRSLMLLLVMMIVMLLMLLPMMAMTATAMMRTIITTMTMTTMTMTMTMRMRMRMRMTMTMTMTMTLMLMVVVVAVAVVMILVLMMAMIIMKKGCNLTILMVMVINMMKSWCLANPQCK